MNDSTPYFPYHFHPSVPATPTLEELRAVIREEVQRALHPTLPGLPDVYHFLQVEATDQDGKCWKGMLYGVEEDQ